MYCRYIIIFVLYQIFVDCIIHVVFLCVNKTVRNVLVSIPLFVSNYLRYGLGEAHFHFHFHKSIDSS